METPSISIKDLYRISGGGPDDAGAAYEDTREAAVLVAEAANSALLFETLGDQAGREILRRFRELGSKPLADHGGVIIRTVGNSVWAYFKDPKQAVYASIACQKAFKAFNEKAEDDKRILTRIGLHFGEIIVEEKDIFGNVANLLSKIVPLLSGGEICVTSPVFEIVKNVAPVPFKIREFPGKNDLPEDIAFHSLIWDEDAGFEPETVATLVVTPLWKMLGTEFADLWEQILADDAGRTIPGLADAAREILPDKSVIFVFENAEDAVGAGKAIISFVNRELERLAKSQPFLPIQAVVDIGRRLSPNAPVTDALSVDWRKIEPGQVHISGPAWESMTDHSFFSIDPPFREDDKKIFHRLMDGPDRKPLLFKYRKMLHAGAGPMCFYCGDRRHPHAECPSKTLEDYYPHALEKLGHKPFSEINRLFFDFLSGYGEENEEGGEHDLARKGFYELYVIFQLRFVKAVWSSEEEDWEEIKTKRRKTRKGGHAWLAFDCLRISSHDRARQLLDTAIKKTPHDFRAYCGLGFLHMEENDADQAGQYFEQALYYAKTRPQRIYVQLLLFRLFYVHGKRFEAERKINDILALLPRCPEAQYQKIKFEFISGDRASALENLAKFIRDRSDFYIVALLDPELAPFDEQVLGELETHFREARDESERVVPIAEKEIVRLKNLIGNSNDEAAELNSLSERIRELSDSESYTGYMEIIRIADLISARAARLIEERKYKTLGMLDNIRETCQERLEFVREYPYRNFIETLYEKLQIIEMRIGQTKDLVRSEEQETFKKAMGRARAFAEEISEIDGKIQRLKFFLQARDFFMTFLKRVVVFLLIDALFIGFIPFAAWLFARIIQGREIGFMVLLQFLLPYMGWLFVILGGIAVVGAVYLAIFKMYHER